MNVLHRLMAVLKSVPTLLDHFYVAALMDTVFLLTDGHAWTSMNVLQIMVAVLKHVQTMMGHFSVVVMTAT